MSMNGLGLLSPNEGRAFELAPGERIRHRRPDPSNTPVAEPSDCQGCGAPLQRHLASCAWCTRPHPSRRADLGALLEVTCLDDAAPRYVPGWSNPRPLPPAGRLVLESGRHMDPGAQGALMGALTVGYGVTDADLERIRRSWFERHVGPLPRRPRRRLVDAVLQALGLR